VTEPTPDPEAARKAAIRAAEEAAAAEKAAAEKAAAEAKKGAAKVVKGSLVTYRHPDPVTGQVLEGAGVVLEAPDGGAVTISPLSSLFLDVDPGNVYPVAGDGA
jgi:hypothetical protein